MMEQTKEEVLRDINNVYELVPKIGQNVDIKDRKFLNIVSNGTPGGTQIYTDDGVAISWVVSMQFHSDSLGRTVATIQFVPDKIDVIACKDGKTVRLIENKHVVDNHIFPNQERLVDAETNEHIPDVESVDFSASVAGVEMRLNYYDKWIRDEIHEKDPD